MPDMKIENLLGDDRGVVLTAVDGGFEVGFAFDRDLVGMIRSLDGTEFDPESKIYLVPATAAAGLASLIVSMREKSVDVSNDLLGITEKAFGHGYQVLDEAGAAGIEPKVSDFIVPGKTSKGVVVGKNESYIAVFTGVGKNDGAPFYRVDRLANLSDVDVEVGQRISVRYNDQFVGKVAALGYDLNDEQLLSQYQETLGQEIDGVTVSEQGDAVGVRFGFDKVLIERIRRVHTAEFVDKGEGWRAKLDVLPYVLRAVQDMRRDFVGKNAELAELTEVARQRVTDAVVEPAFTNNKEYAGPIVAVGTYLALQSVGRNAVKVHNLVDLDATPEVGVATLIKYDKLGKGLALGSASEKSGPAVDR